MKPQKTSGLPAMSTISGAAGFFCLTLLLMFTLLLPVSPAQSAPAPGGSTVFLPLRILAPGDSEPLTSQADQALAAAARSQGFNLAARPLLAELEDSWPPSPADLQALALPPGARYLALGNLTQLGRQLSIDATVYDLSGEQAPRHFTALAADSQQLAAVLLELSDEVMFHTDPTRRISTIHIEGNEKTDSGAILRRVESKAGGRLDPEKLQDDLRSIFAMGFFDDVQIRAEETAAGTRITFTVTEKPVISQVIIGGNRKLKEKDIRERIAVVPNTIINPRLVREAADSITQLYKEKGYQDTLVESEIIDTAHNRVNVRFEIEEGERVHIREISFTGNQSFRPRQLRKQIKTKTKGIFSWFTRSGRLQPDILEQDRARLAAFYLNSGFIDVRVGEPEVELVKNRLVVTFNIEEGARYRVGEIGLAGDLIFEEEELREKIKLSREEFFSRQVLREDIDRLSDRYAQDGYAFTDVEPLVTRDDENLRMDVVYHIDKNVLVHINRIIIRGNTRTRDNVIRRQVKVAEGGILDTTAVRKSMENLQHLNFFEEIDVRPEPALLRDDLMDIQIDVKEKPTGTFSIGAGYSSMDHVMVMGQISQENFMGRGQRLAFQADISSKANYYNLSFTEPHLDDSNLLFGFDLYNWRREYIDYTRTSTGGALRFGYPLGDKWRAYWGYGYEKSKISGVGANPSQWILDAMNLKINSFIRLGVNRDTRDNHLDPTRGSFHDIGVKHAGGFLGGDTAFSRFEGSTTWFFPWDGIPGLRETKSWWLNSTTFRLKGAMGYIRENEDGKLPIYEKFFLGGLRTMRGFETATISPRDPATGDRIGGEKMWYMNSEWIFPIVDDIGLKGLVFFDAGNTYTRSENWSASGLKKSVGLGFRWLSPMGPLRLEWGYNLDPEDDERRTVWDFSMGGVF